MTQMLAVAILLLLFLGYTPLGWFGGMFLLGAWIGKQLGK